MEVKLVLAFDEGQVLRLAFLMARNNAELVRANPTLPLLYDSGVVYRVEKEETWSDVLSMYAAGHEDCDSLATARAGEIVARGVDAFRPGDVGYSEVMRLRPAAIRAEPYLTTRAPKGQSGGYHLCTRFLVGGVWFKDDPSLRLGMSAERGIDRHVLARWRRLGVRPVTRPLPV